MEKITKYIDNFFSRRKKNARYSMNFNECMAFMDEFFTKGNEDVFHLICNLFNFGYVRGYKAAMAEMRKGGAA